LPTGALPLLAELRCAPGVDVIADGEFAWLRWPSAQEFVTRRLLPIAGLTLFVRRDNCWYELGRRIPAVAVALDRPGVPLIKALTPTAIQPEMTANAATQKLSLTLTPDSTPRQTTAIRCSIAVLEKWIDQATTAQFAGLRAAVAHDEVLVLGGKLPVLPGNRRYWGNTILSPLGLRPNPPLSERVLSQALKLQTGSIALLEEASVEVLDNFAEVSRAGVRMASRIRP
jgi:hypothetical protein